MKWGRSQTIEAAADPLPSTEALDVLVAGIFDYAGMFPPASLELDAAIWESARSPRLRRPHLVGADLVVSLDDLARLDEERLRMAGFGDTEARLAVVGVDVAQLPQATMAVSRKNEELAGVVRIVSLETHGINLPGTGLRDAAAALPDTRIYIEPRMPDSAWERNGPGIFRLLDRLASNDATVGLKVRGSGQTAVSAATLGQILPQVVAEEVPFKATAGLHHPVVEAQYGNALGFLGLAAALRLRGFLKEAMPPEAIAQCVAETDPKAFAFDGGLAWRGHAVPVAALREAVRMRPFAIGSCSLREPDDDLARLFG
ncbi:MAG: hypothetical protein ABR562_01100 [Thermoplasmatota archaeon]